MAEKTFRLPAGKSYSQAADFVATYLQQNENMETQTLIAEDKSIIVQGRIRHGSVKQFMGLDRAITVHFSPANTDSVKVTITAGKWLDKLAAGTVSMFILWPLLVTSAYGAFKQSQFPNKIFEAIETYRWS